MDRRRTEAQDTARSFWQDCSELNAPDWLFEVQAVEIENIFLPKVRKDDEILDVGCGDGRFSVQVAGRCASVDAFDLSEKLIEKARANAGDAGNIRFEVRDAADGTLDKDYDHVTCMGLFTAIPDDSQFRRIAESVASRVKAGGYLLLKDSLVPGEDRIVISDGYAAIYRNEKDYLGFFQSLGFELEEKRVLGLLPCGQHSKLMLFRKGRRARKKADNPKIARRVACFAAMPFHTRALEPIADGFEDSLVSDDLAEIQAWNPDVIVVADAPPIPDLRAYCDTRNAILIGLQHGAANRYMAPEREYALCDYFCGSDWDIARFTGKGVAPRKGVLRTGNPWVDEVFTVPKRSLNRENPTILFAPTYNPEISAAGFFEGRLIDLIRSVYPESRVIIKPHPAILQYDHPYVAQYRPLFEKWVSEWRRTASEVQGIEFADDHESPISRFFPDADILISDSSSLIFEFMALDRPILLYASGREIGIWERDPDAPGNSWRDIGVEFSTEEQFVSALRDAFETHAAARSAIQRHRTEELHGEFQDGKSHLRVIEAIKDLPFLDVCVLGPESEEFTREVKSAISNCRVCNVDRADLNRFFRESSARHVLVIDRPRARIECADFVSSAIDAMQHDPIIAAAGSMKGDLCIYDREKVLEVGGFDESLSARIVSRGYRIHAAWDEKPVIRFGRGFHPEDNGVRWLSEDGVLTVGRSVLDQESPPVRVKLDLMCTAPQHYPSFPFAVQVFQDDQPVGEVRFEQAHQTVSVELPAKKELQTIRLVSEASYVPKEIGINGDPRRLSVIVRKTRIEEESVVSESPENPARLIAFYLPQFHPIPENDKWWGKGFTDWDNVKKAEPLFEEHHQPHVPSELGYYDLRSPEVRKAQADLARDHGIEGFCYWHYWFDGKRLLEGPFDAVLETGEPDFPFCLAWANENWTRTWDGHEDHILQAQEYGGAEDDKAHFEWLAEAFADRRYIRVDGKPLFLIYRPGDMPDASTTIALWRRLAENSGLYLVAIRISDDPTKAGHRIEQGFDAELLFQPSFGKLWDAFGAGKIEGAKLESEDGTEPGLVLSYRDASELMANGVSDDPDCLRTVVPCWDNTPRRKSGAFILRDSTPDLYEKWLQSEVERIGERPSDRRLVFINAWNEWGEGNHLEPASGGFGRGYLLATKRACVAARVSSLHSRGETAEAVLMLERHLASDPDYAQGHNDLGVLLCETGDIEKAQAHLEKALSLDQNNDTFRRNLADLRRALGRTPGVKPTPAEAPGPEKLRIIAILAVFNEGDIIHHVIRDLVEQDIEVFILDHHSTDNSVAEASKWLGKGLLKIETFPEESGIEIPNNVFSLRYILLRKEQLVRELGPAWYINADTDEFRESPWPGLNLRRGIERVDAQGYNTINFAIFDFKPTGDSFVAGEDVRDHLTHYAESQVAWDHMQARCWKHWGQPFQLWQTGGHLVEFEGRRIYPIPFILRHYPIRSQRHGLMKIFNERKNRFDANERAASWHVQYDDIAKEGHSFLHDEKDLVKYDRLDVCRGVFARYGGIEVGADAHERLSSGEERLTSIVILARNQLEYTKKCLESIGRCTDVPYELVIVDNGSTDGTAEYLAEFRASRSKPDACRAVKVVRHEANLGYAAGNNSGMAVSEGAYVCIMNNDIVVTPGWLDRLTRLAEYDPRIGIVGPMSNRVSGQQLAQGVSYDQDLLRGLDGFAERWAGESERRYETAPRLVGFCMLVKRAVIERIGGFDDGFGIGNYEDDDFCIRAAVAGFRAVIAKNCFVHHFGSRTFSGERINYEALMAENWEVFKQKWGLPADLPLRAPYEIGRLLAHSFDDALHYIPISPDNSEGVFRAGGTWFAAPDWGRSEEWQRILDDYVGGGRARDGSLLRLYAGHLTNSTAEDAFERVSALLKRLNIPEDACPEIEITDELPNDRATRIILSGSGLDEKLLKQFPGRCVDIRRWDKAA